MRSTAPSALLLALAAFSPAWGSAVASADVITLNAAADATLFQSTLGDTASGSGPNLFTGSNSSINPRRALLRFDLSAIPAGSTITGVSLNLFMNQTNAPASNVAAYRVTNSWGEGASSASAGNPVAAQTNDATWIHRFYNTTAWTNPGGDFAALASSTISVGGVGAYAWTGASMVSDVQAMLDNPAANYGWLLMGDEASNSAKRYSSREATNAAQRPALVVEYVIPSPGAAVVLGAGLIAVGRKRKAKN